MFGAESASGRAVLILRVHGVAQSIIGDEECSPGALTEGTGAAHGIGYGISVGGMGVLGTEVECTGDEVVFTTLMTPTTLSTERRAVNGGVQGFGSGIATGVVSQARASELSSSGS